MALPSSVTTNLWPDFKNSFVGPFPKVVQVAQLADSLTNEPVGSPLQEKVAQSFLAVDGELTSVDFLLRKNVTPTDLLAFQLCEDNSNLPGTVIATGTSLSPARLSGARVFRRTVFLQPPTLVPGNRYWIVLSRTGSTDPTNIYHVGTSTADPYADGKLMKFGSGAWSDLTGVDAVFKINFHVDGRYQLGIDKTNNKIRMFKSTDGGDTWSESDAVNAPAIIATATLKSITGQVVDRRIHVFTITSATRFDIKKFDTDTDTWTTQEDGDTSTTISTNVSGAAPLFGAFRHSPTTFPNVAVYNGLAETVMGAARRRIKLSRGPTYQTTEFDVVGSLNTPDTTLPGLAVDYDFRAALTDPDDVVHIFWTQSDDSSIRHRAWLVNNTFATANLLGSTPLGASNSGAYSVGLPTNYYRSNEWRIAIPVTDGSSIKIGRVAAASASTASAWTSATAVTAAIDMTNSNPCALVADNEQGGRLYLVFKKSDDKVYYTHDQGTDAWVTEQELHPGTKVVGGISANVLIDAIATTYLDTNPTPDEIRYDHLDVFIAKRTLVSGTSINETRSPLTTDYMVQSDTDESAGTVVTTSIYRSGAEGEVPQLMSVIEDRGGGALGETFVHSERQVEVATSVSGADAAVGITGT